MIGRLDTKKGICPDCNGTGRDPKKRTRKCSGCDGTAMVEVCTACGYIVGRGCSSQALDSSYCEMKSARGITVVKKVGIVTHRVKM